MISLNTAVGVEPNFSSMEQKSRPYPFTISNMNNKEITYTLYVQNIGRVKREIIIQRIADSIRCDINSADAILAQCEKDVSELRSGLLLAVFGKASRSEVISKFSADAAGVSEETLRSVVEFAEWLVAKG